MLVSMVEQALQKSSNSLFAFIILTILLGTKFSATNSQTRDTLPGIRRYTNRKPEEIADLEWCPDRVEFMSRPEKQAEEKLTLVQEACNSEMNGKEGQEDKGCEDKQEDGDGDGDENEDNGGEPNGDNDELRRRIKEFITMVNREWKEENLKEQKD